MMDVGGFFFDFEAVRTASGDREAQTRRKDHPRHREVATSTMGRRERTSTCFASKTSRFRRCFALFASKAAAMRFSAFSLATRISSFFLAFLTCVVQIQSRRGPNGPELEKETRHRTSRIAWMRFSFSMALSRDSSPVWHGHRRDTASVCPRDA